jgi:hypothetical protein
MKVVAFITEYAPVDRIIRHRELTLVAEKPPPAHASEQVAFMTAEESGDYEWLVSPRGETNYPGSGGLVAVLPDHLCAGVRARWISSS